MTDAFDGDGVRETFRDIAVWVREIPERSPIKIKSERWLWWIALGFLGLVYAFAWLG
jgi:hypothetical protein